MQPKLTTACLWLTILTVGCHQEDGSRVSSVDVLPAAAVQQLAVAGNTPSDPLHMVRDGALRADGTFALAVGSRVRIYSSTGRMMESVGQRGYGPGDFRFPFQITELDGGRLGVWDTTLSRYSIISGGRVVETLSPDLDGIRGVILPVGVVGGFEGRPLLVFRSDRAVSGMRQMESGVRRDTVWLHLDSDNSRSIDTIGWVPGTEEFFWNAETSWGTRSLIFPQHVRIEAVEGGVIVADASTGKIRRFPAQATGGVEDILDMPPSDPSLSDGLVRRERSAMKDSIERVYMDWWLADATGLRERFQSVDDAPANESLAAFDALEAERDGTLWIRRYVLRTDSVQRWIRVPDGEGAPDLEVRFPAGEKVLDIRGDQILVRRTGALDVETVVLYRILPPNPAR